MTTPAPLCSHCGEKPVLVKKVMLCSGCYWRQRRRGTLDYQRLPNGATALERFEFYVARSEEPGGCWIWRGPVNSSEDGRDYGRIWDGARSVLAHRWSYEHFVRPIPDDLVIDHTCETPRCVRPDHLEPVPQPVNVQRGTRWPVDPNIPRTERVKPDVNRPNCLRCGKPYVISENGRKHCPTCRNAQVREWTRRTGKVTGEGSGARQRERTHCPAGHEYTEANTYRPPKNPSRRDCLTCRRERSRQGHEQERENRPPREEQTRCARGHEFTPENTIIRPDGRRNCRACKNRSKRERKAREREVRPNQAIRGRICPPDCTCGRHRRAK